MANPYDGNSKHWTKDCIACPYYLNITFNKLSPRDEMSERDICNWGVAFKVLVKDEEHLRKCNLINKESPNRGRAREDIIEVFHDIEREFLISRDRGDNCR